MENSDKCIFSTFDEFSDVPDEDEGISNNFSHSKFITKLLIIENFEFMENKRKYDLSNGVDGAGVWSDIYSYNQEVYQFDYPVRLYESVRDLDQFLVGTALKIIEVINDFNRNDLEYSGWKEFVLVKS